MKFLSWIVQLLRELGTDLPYLFEIYKNTWQELFDRKLNWKERTTALFDVILFSTLFIAVIGFAIYLVIDPDNLY